MTKKILGLTDAAIYFKTSDAWIYSLIRRGKIKPRIITIGRLRVYCFEKDVLNKIRLLRKHKQPYGYLIAGNIRQ